MQSKSKMARPLTPGHRCTPLLDVADARVHGLLDVVRVVVGQRFHRHAEPLAQSRSPFVAQYIRTLRAPRRLVLQRLREVVPRIDVVRRRRDGDVAFAQCKLKGLVDRRLNVAMATSRSGTAWALNAGKSTKVSARTSALIPRRGTWSACSRSRRWRGPEASLRLACRDELAFALAAPSQRDVASSRILAPRARNQFWVAEQGRRLKAKLFIAVTLPCLLALWV